MTERPQKRIAFDATLIAFHLEKTGQTMQTSMYLAVKRIEGFPGRNFVVVEQIDQHGNYRSFLKKVTYPENAQTATLNKVLTPSVGATESETQDREDGPKGEYC